MNSTFLYPRHIAALKPYIPGKPADELAASMPDKRVIKLASNENPSGASPRAMAALKRADLDMSKYPDNDSAELAAALAEFHGVSRDMIVVGAGSESILGTAASTLLALERRTSYAQYSFQAYVNAAQRLGAAAIEVPSPNFVVDLEGLQRTLAQEPSLIYIANPGNPTGTCLDPAQLVAFIRAVPAGVVVLLDEAYFEYMPSRLRIDSVALVKELPNLLVTRTFSKAYGLAGLRVGYGIAHQSLAEMLRRVRAPFTVTESAQRAAVAALADTDFLDRTVELNGQSKALMHEGLTRLGFPVVPSHTNFLLVKVGDGPNWSQRLERRGLIVRPLISYGLREYVRISVGTLADTRSLLEAFEAELLADHVK